MPCYYSGTSFVCNLIVFVFDRRDKIIKILKCLYGMHTKKNLPIYDIQENNLRGYTTTEKNKKQNIEKYPPEDFRNYGEDLIPEDKPTASSDQQEKRLSERMGNYDLKKDADNRRKYLNAEQDDNGGSEDEEEE